MFGSEVVKEDGGFTLVAIPPFVERLVESSREVVASCAALACSCGSVEPVVGKFLIRFRIGGP